MESIEYVTHRIKYHSNKKEDENDGTQTEEGATAAFFAISKESNLCTLSKKFEATGEGWTANTSIPIARTYNLIF